MSTNHFLDATGMDTQKKPFGRLIDYLSIARFDHSTKHIFIIPGFVLACLLRGPALGFGFAGIWPLASRIVLGLAVAVCIASANYTINEYLDRDFDRFHPTKSRRASVQRELDHRIVWAMWLGFVVCGLSAAAMMGHSALLVGCVFAAQGLVYNVPPIRTKDKAFIDVISESINNPLRLLLGWAMVDTGTLAPGSVILAYWFGGAFLMAAKRLSEYREIVTAHGRDLLCRYRASFAGYDEASLIVSCFVYGLLSSFFLAVFLIKYRVEYLLLMPAISMLFGYYLILSIRTATSVQNPEKLFREYRLIAMVVIIAALFLFTTLVDIPMLNTLTQQHYIQL